MTQYERARNRSFKATDTIWDAAKLKAKSLPFEISLSSIIRLLLSRWLAGEIFLFESEKTFSEGTISPEK